MLSTALVSEMNALKTSHLDTAITFCILNFFQLLNGATILGFKQRLTKKMKTNYGTNRKVSLVFTSLRMRVNGP